MFMLVSNNKYTTQSTLSCTFRMYTQPSRQSRVRSVCIHNSVNTLVYVPYVYTTQSTFSCTFRMYTQPSRHSRVRSVCIHNPHSRVRSVCIHNSVDTLVYVPYVTATKYFPLINYCESLNYKHVHNVITKGFHLKKLFFFFFIFFLSQIIVKVWSECKCNEASKQRTTFFNSGHRILF